MFHFLAADIRFVKLNNVKTSLRLKSWLDRVLIFTNVIGKVPFFKDSVDGDTGEVNGSERNIRKKKNQELCPRFYLAHLDFSPPPITSPGSPRMRQFMI